MSEVQLGIVSDVFIRTDQNSKAAFVKTRLPTLMFALGEIYIDPANHRPLKVIALGGDLITLQDVTFPDSPGDSFTMPLFQARVRLLQTQYIKNLDPL